MQAPYGIWPALQYLSTAQQTATPVRWYIDPVAGSDIGTFRGSQSQPLRTLEGLRNRLQSTWSQAPQLVSLRNAIYPWATMRPTLGGSQVIFHADEQWDSSVVNIIASGAAGAATTGSSIVGVFVADAHRGKSLRFTSGAAAGQRKTIQTNTAGALIPCVAFNPAPAQNDTYQIFDSNVSVTPDGSQVWQRIGDAGIANKGRVHAYPDDEGYGFSGIKFVVGPSFRFLFDQGRYALFGAEMAGAAGSTLPWRMVWSSVMAGAERVDGPVGTSLVARMPFSWLGAPSLTAWAGWGISGNALPHGVSAGLFSGYVVVGAGGPAVLTDISYNYSDVMRVDICGGSLRNATSLLRLDAPSAQLLVLNTGDIPPEFIGGATPSGLLAANRGLMQLEAGAYSTTGAGPVLQVTAGGQLYLSSVATGQAASGDSVTAIRGGRVYLTGANVPNLGRGGGATDYNNGNGAPQNKTFFAANGTHMPAFTDGSTIIRCGLI